MVDFEALRYSKAQALPEVPTRMTSSVEPEFSSRKAARRALRRLQCELMDAQSRLFARRDSSLLLILQGMDTSGKDGLIRHVFRQVSPVGLQVHSFGPPSEPETHDHFLARYRRALPKPGYISVFNRSYFEQLMYLRVHPELRPRAVTATEAAAEVRAICEFERALPKQGVTVIKVFLHICKAKQKKRLLSRATAPEKNWKLRRADLTDHRMWDQHYRAFQEAMDQTDFDAAPWFVVPADDKWAARYWVALLILQTLEHLAPEYPKPDLRKRSLIRDVCLTLSQ